MNEIEKELLERSLRRIPQPEARHYVREAVSLLNDTERKLLISRLALESGLGVIGILGLQLGLTQQQVNNNYRSTINVRNSVTNMQANVGLSFTSLLFAVNRSGARVDEVLRRLSEVEQDLQNRMSRVQLDILEYRSETNRILDAILFRVSRILGQIDDLERSVETLLERTRKTEEKVTKIDRFLTRNVGPKLNDLATRVQDILNWLRETLLPRLNALESSFTRLRELVETAIGEYIAGINTYVAAVTSALAAISAEIGAFTTLVETTLYAINGNLVNVVKGIARLEKQLKDQAEAIDRLPVDVSDKVADSIVGESYYRWDSTSNYYPTVVFLFNLVNSTGGVGRSQIKLRYPKRSEEVTPQDVERLRVAVQALRGLQYDYGDQRLNFVSSNRLAKTVLNVQTPDEGKRVLQRVCQAVQIPYEDNLVTITSANRRPPVNRRTRPIGEWKLRPIQNVFGVYRLSKVKLMINGMSRPETLLSD